MKFQGLKVILSMLAVAAMFGSCIDSDGENTYESSIGECLTYGENISKRASNFNKKMSFIAKYDNNAYTSDISIVGMQLPEVSSTIDIPRMELKGLAWKYNSQGWKTVTAENVTPVITGMSVVPYIKKLDFAVADVFDANGNYRPGIQYRISLEFKDNEYELVGCCMTGTTVATDPDGVSYTPEADGTVNAKPVYWVDYNFAEEKADIYMYNAKFLGAMPSLNLMFPDVPYKIENGKIMLQSDALTPMFKGVPYPSFPISNLTGTIDYTTSSMNLNFTCNFRGNDYVVKVDCKY